MAPSLDRARAVANRLDARWATDPLRPQSWASFLCADPAPRILLCPEGRSLDADVGFLKAAGARLFWPPPPEELRGAVAGLRGDHLPLPKNLPLRGASDQASQRALLLEGAVTARRARRALKSSARAWIVEHPIFVRLSARELQDLEREGVRWTVLNPVRLVALLATPLLARSRNRWRTFLPARTRAIVLDRLPPGGTRR